MDSPLSRRRSGFGRYSTLVRGTVGVLVPDQGAVSGDQGGAFVRFRVSTSSCMRERRPEGVGWYDFVCLRNNIEEGLDSEEEQWVTGSESESDTSESDIEDGQDD